MRTTAKQSLLVLMAAAISSHFLCSPTTASAQTRAASLSTTMGTLVVDRNSAALMFNGERYSLAIQRAKLGPATADAAPFVAIVYNLRSPIDIVGTYVATTPTGSADRNAKTILLQNSSGVVLRFDVKGEESEAPRNLDGLIISLQ